VVAALSRVNIFNRILTAVILVLPMIQVRPPRTQLQGSPPTTSRLSVSKAPTEASPIADNGVEFDRLTIEDGLSENSVLCILQDSLGFMWFGSWDGLNKYDGYEFTVYTPDPQDPNSVSDNSILAIIESRSGLIWIGTGDGGLNRFDRQSETFTHYRHDPESSSSLSSNLIQALLEDVSGTLWIGTGGGGLNWFNPDSQRFVSYQNDPSNASSLSSNQINTLFQDRSGRLWIGTTGGGLNRFKSAVESEPIPGLTRDEDNSGGLVPPIGSFIRYQHDPIDPYSLSHDDVYAIFQDSSGILWIGAGDGSLNRYDPSRDRFIHYRIGPGDFREPYPNAIRTIIEDPQGFLWVGATEGGLYRFDKDTGTFLHFYHDPGDLKSLSSNSVRSLYADRSGALWVGTNGGGLNKHNLSQKDFTYYDHDPRDPNSLSEGVIFAIHEDPAGILWVGSSGGGLDRFDRTRNQFTHFLSDPDDLHSLGSNTVYSVYADRHGTLWIGTARGGLILFDPQTGFFKRYLHDPEDPTSISGNTVGDIYQDDSGRLWIGTYDDGLNMFDRKTGTFIHYRHDPDDPHSLSHDTVSVIFEDRSGTLWIGTNDGLNRLEAESGKFTRFRHIQSNPDSLSDNHVLSLCEDHHGTLWVGTNGGGLDKFNRDENTFSHYHLKDGLPNQVVYGILEDAQGNLWISTNRGLSRFDQNMESFSNYYVSDGLPSNEFNGNAYYKNQAGEMFFGGLKGLVVFNPEAIKDNPYIPPVVLTSLTQGGEPMALNQALESVNSITLEWPNNYFEFEFAALSYPHNEENMYAYMLEGFDEKWNYLGRKRFGRYTNLPGGDYTLWIKGSNHDGVWNEAGASITITVIPPLWESGWLRAGLVLILFAGAIGGYRLRVKSIKARNRELESLVRQRTYEIERKRQVAEGLRDILVSLNTGQSLERSLNYIVNQALRLSGAEITLIYQNKEDTDQEIVAICREVRGLPSKDIDIDPKFIGQILPPLLDQPLGVKKPWSYGMELDKSRDHEIIDYPSLLCAPISIEGEIYGGVALLFLEEHIFSKDELELSSLFADQAALAIGNDRLRERIREMAVAAERNRLARDLHDAVTQTLFSASLIAEALPELWESDAEEGRQLLKELRQLSRGALAEMRSLLLELLPAAIAEADLGDLLQQLSETITGRTGLPVRLDVQNTCRLPADVQVALYRIAQEALNNVAKHARPSQVWLSLNCKQNSHNGRLEKVTLEVRDDGCGFNPKHVPPDCFGLGIMNERAQAIDASLNIHSKPGEGAWVQVEWKG
jgi:ligand-binding sensor domain-containing protein/signal transduction histidine kinase